MININDFVAKYNGKHVDYDKSYGSQLHRPVLLSSLSTSLNRFLNSIKTTKEYASIIDFNFSNPSAALKIPMNSVEPRLIVNSYPTVSNIGCISTDSKIYTSIIQSITINMVNILARLGVNYQTVQLIKSAVRKSFLKIWLTPSNADSPLSTTVSRSIKNILTNFVQNTDELPLFLAVNNHKLSLASEIQ